MDTIFQKITEWLKEMLVSGIMESLSGMTYSLEYCLMEIERNSAATDQNIRKRCPG